MELDQFVIVGLATWRISSLLVKEAGPGGVFLLMRERAGITHDEDGRQAIVPDGFWGGFFSCIWCASLWIGAFWGALVFFTPVLAIFFAAPFALSAVAVVVQKFLEE